MPAPQVLCSGQLLASFCFAQQCLRRSDFRACIPATALIASASRASTQQPVCFGFSLRAFAALRALAGVNVRKAGSGGFYRDDEGQDARAQDEDGEGATQRVGAGRACLKRRLCRSVCSDGCVHVSAPGGIMCLHSNTATVNLRRHVLIGR